ncbi:enoyl-CoA hydratase/isomerase family protein [candidate division KSB1 bacterium]
MISMEKQNKIAIIKLTRGVTNPINLELIRKLSDTLDNIENDPEIRGLVLTSANDKFFSIGFDIPELIGLDEDDFGVFYRSVNQVCLKLYTLPKPTLAAVNGHAIAGGTVVALCCDYRYIADGRKLMGLNEIKLGVTVPYPVDCILRDLAGSRNATEIMESGEFYEPEVSLQMGLVDRIVPQGELLSESIKKIEQLGNMPAEAFAAIKRNKTEPMVKKIAEKLKEKEDLFINLWFSDNARNALNEAIKNF